MTVWNAQWYGGHHVLGYSMLFAPLAAWPGPAWVGALGAVAATAAFVAAGARGGAVAGRGDGRDVAVRGRRAQQRGDRPDAVHARHRARGGGVAVRRARRASAWRALRRACSRSRCVLASPVAGAFLALAAAARAAGERAQELGRPATLALPVAVGGATMALLFPEGGDDRFVATAFWPMLAVSVAAAALLAPGRRALRAGVRALPRRARRRVRDPDAVRPERAAAAGPARAGAARCSPRAPAAPRAAIAAVLVALVYLQWLPAVRAVAEAHGDPSTEEAFFADPRAFLEGAVQPGERVEVAFTHNHWEAAHLATAVPLARGWERQLDEKANPLFYDGRPLTPERYHRWLHDSAVRWVALPDAPLDYSAEAEARLLERGLPYLRLAHESAGLEDLGGARRRRRRPPTARA